MAWNLKVEDACIGAKVLFFFLFVFLRNATDIAKHCNFATQK